MEGQGIIDKLKLGSLLATLRNKAEITQRELAQKIGITHQQIQKYENGSTTPTIERLCEISEALNTNPAGIIEYCRSKRATTPLPSIKILEGSKEIRKSDQKHLQAIFRHFSQIEGDDLKEEASQLIRALMKTKKGSKERQATENKSASAETGQKDQEKQ